MIKSGQHTSLMYAALVAGPCCASMALAETPVSEQEVLDLFMQHERLRTEQQFVRSHAAPLIAPAFDAHSLERQLWQSQWWLQHHKKPQPSGVIPYCQPPYFIPPPPFRQCPNLPLH